MIFDFWCIKFANLFIKLLTFLRLILKPHFKNANFYQWEGGVSIYRDRLPITCSAKQFLKNYII